MDYYSVDSILADEEKVKVRFEYQIDNFGFYINTSLGVLRANTKADLPFFLISFLLKNEHCTLVESHVGALKNDLDADAAMVDLKDIHFFILNSHFEDTAYLLDVFYERISSFVKTIVKEDFCESDLSLMSCDEKRYLVACRKNFKRFQDFYFRKICE